MALTDLQLRQALPREREYKISDGGGLYILARRNGSKLWRMKYRQHGKEQKLSFGRFPEVGLKNARLGRVEIGRGGDRARGKREEKVAAMIGQGDTFGAVAHEYIAKRELEGLAMATSPVTGFLFETSPRRPKGLFRKLLDLFDFFGLQLAGDLAISHSLKKIVRDVTAPGRDRVLGMPADELASDPVPFVEEAAVTRREHLRQLGFAPCCKDQLLVGAELLLVEVLPMEVDH